MKIKKEPAEIWKEYQRGISYKTGLGLYETVERNENFYNDRQWEGVIAPDLPKPVFNYLKQSVNYYIAMLISDDIAANFELAGGAGTEDDVKFIQDVISAEIDNVIEQAKVKNKNRKAIRNAAVDGDTCFYIWFDPDAQTSIRNGGEIKVDLIDNTNVYFGNPSTNETEEQPYIVLAYRKLTSDVKEEAKENGIDPDEITPDNETTYMNADQDSDNDYTTVLLKMWKERKAYPMLDELGQPKLDMDGEPLRETRTEVHIKKTTQRTELLPERNTGYRLYPISFFTWEAVKNSYHGVSPLIGKIENQKFVNKLYAMAMIFTQKMAFPKLFYDKVKLPEGYNNKIGEAIGVIGNPNEALMANFQSADMNASVPNLIESTIRTSKETMGANDTALGNVKNPQNSSAIIATQKAAGMALDIQRMDFYDFVESYIRVMIDIMRVNYGTRQVLMAQEDGSRMLTEFDFEQLDKLAYNLRIDIGQGSYWSELTQLQTLDNLWNNKIIQDAVLYLESIPDGYLKGKNKIVQQIKNMQMAQVPTSVGALPNRNTSLVPNEGEADAVPRPIPPPAGGIRSNAEQGVAADGLNGLGGGLPAGGGNTPLAEGDNTAEMKQIIDELATLTPKQILKTIDALPYSDEDKIRLLDVMKVRGKA